MKRQSVQPAKLKQIVYCSKAVTEFDGEKLHGLLTQARNYNGKKKITGILMHSGDFFAQCIEGKPEEIDRLYEKIKSDSRHDDIATFYQSEPHARSFSEWSMGCVEITNNEALELSTAAWEEIRENHDSSENPSPAFILMQTLWNMKKSADVN